MHHIQTRLRCTSTTRRRRSVQAVCIAAVVALSAACGSSDTDDTPGPSSGGPASPQVAAAQAEVNKLLQPPTSIGIDVPLQAAPSGGGPFVFLSCDNGLCQVLAKGMAEGAEAAGFEFKNIPIELADPATLVAGMQQALQMDPKPIGVSFAGLPEAVWSSQVPAFEAAGVPLIPIAVTDVTLGPAVPAALDGEVDATAQAAAIANFFIANSNGNGKALVINVPDVGSTKVAAEVFQSTVAAGCSGCSTKTIDITLAQIASNGVVPATVSALQRAPDTTYVVTPQGEWTQGLVAAAKAAGLDDIKLIGINPAKFNQQELATGDAVAFSLLPFNIMGWKAVDVALRHKEGSPMPADGSPLPVQLLTRETVGEPADSIDRPTDYREQFTKLWKVQ